MIRYQNDTLTLFESALFRTTTTVFHNEDLILLVDPNWLPQEVVEIRNYVKQLRDDRPFYLLFTHSDYDHIIAYEAFPDAQVIATQSLAETTEQAPILKQIRDFDESYYLTRDYSITYPKVDYQVRENGQSLLVGNTRLTFYLAPGHNADGMFTVIEPAGIWIVGDYWSNIEFPYVYHSFAEYRQTIGLLPTLAEKHAFQCLIPGHGDRTEEWEEVLRRQAESLAYLDQLEKCLRENSPFDLEVLWKQYDFPAGMLPFHQGNEKLMRKELGLQATTDIGSNDQ